MFYSDELIEEVRQRNDIVDVISSYVKLQKKGNTHFGLCPFHNEKTGSFSVSGPKQMYYCFGCGEGGNVISFLMKYENYSFKEAIEHLAQRAGVSLPTYEVSDEQRKAADIKNAILEINKETAKFFVYSLRSENGERAYEYFRGRSLSDETIKKFGLGYCIKQSNLLYDYLKGKGFKDEAIKESGLFSFSEKGVLCKFFNRAMFPIFDINNRVIGFGGRVMGDGEPKYLNSPETILFDKSRNLYGMNYARNSRMGYFLLCEGYMDVISLHQAGFSNAVASLGTAFTSQQASVLKRYAQDVYITYDSDGAGRKAALRAIPILREAGIKVKVVNMKPYKDPDEFIKNLGSEEYSKRIEEARNGFLFTIDCLYEETNKEDPDSMSDFIKNTAAKLLGISNEIERNVYIETVSREYSIQAELLNNYIRKMALNYSGKETKETQEGENKPQKKHEDGTRQAQKILLTWLVDNPGLYNKISRYISESDFIDPLYNRVVTIFFEQIRDGAVNPARIINCFDSEDEHKEVAALFNTGLREDLTETELKRAITETVMKVKQNSLDYARKNAKTVEEKQNVLLEMRKLKAIQIQL